MASAPAPDITALKDAVYEGCLEVWDENERDPRMTFRQSDIQDLDVMESHDVNTLLQVVQRLLDEKLFKVVHADGIAWKLRTKEEAKRYVATLLLYQLRIFDISTVKAEKLGSLKDQIGRD